MNYPEWAPEGLSSFRAWIIATGQEYGDDEAVELNLIDKLLMDNRMRYVWLALKRRANQPGCDIRFSMRVCELSNGPPRLQSLSKQEVIEKGKRVIATARELRAMIKDIGIYLQVSDLVGDMGFVRGSTLFHKCRDTLKKHRVHRSVQRAWEEMAGYFLDMDTEESWELLSEMEKIMEKVIEQAIQQERILARPHHENASLHYFVRCLTQHMKQEFGGPLRQAVANTATVVFDLPNRGNQS